MKQFCHQQLRSLLSSWPVLA